MTRLDGRLRSSIPTNGTDLAYVCAEDPVLIALTGTPGTGKSSVAALLRDRGFAVCDLGELAESSGARTSYDSNRQTWNIDLGILAEAIPNECPLVLVGHYSHLLPVDLVVVARCHPNVVRMRLEERGWSRRKIEENVEAEALGVITMEAIRAPRAFEFDTTSASPEESAEVVARILAGKGDAHRAGTIDWSEVILDWY